jgi:2-alkyl-3-oxoalkanoate reductase
MKILITGPNGLIGSHVAERLQSQGHELRLMLRRTSDISFLEDVKAYERVEGDMRDAESLCRAVQGVDTVLHIGGLTKARREADYQAVNGKGTVDIAAAAANAGVRRFVYISSLAASGPSPDGKPRPLDAEPRPIVPYGRSKLAGEVGVLAQARRMGVVILRPPVVYGPRDKAMLPLFKLAKLRFFPLYGDGLNRLSFIHVYDVADAVVSVTVDEKASGIYTACDGAQYTWRDVLSAFEKAMGKGRVLGLPTPPAFYTAAGYAAGLVESLVRQTLPLNPEEVLEMRQRYWLVDNERITRELGWQPKILVEEGLVQTLTWYRERGWF